MYAHELMIWLHERLADRGTLEQTRERFERLRGNALLPRGRENASVRLSDEQIASAVLGFAHPLPGVAGHASLILGELCPVGGLEASYRDQATLRGLIGNLIGLGVGDSELSRLTLSVEQDFKGEDYTAVLYIREKGLPRAISFVSKYATSLLASGKQENYEHERLDKPTAVQRSFGLSFFRDLSRAVNISRHLNRPLKTDWREYEKEEEKAAFHLRLGARHSSDFLNLRVDALVTWPKEPMRVKFGSHHLVLFPKTKDYSHSISIDLANERISADDARSLMNRMLSVMSWCDDQPASLHEGWSGGPVPTPIQKPNLAFMTMQAWYFCRTLPDNEQLLRCLAFYRDGLNAYSAGLASHSVLSFFRVIETKYHNRPKAIRWVNAVFNDISSTLSDRENEEFEEDRKATGGDVGTYIYLNCRVATAHAAKDAPSDPDVADEIHRLLNAARVIQRLARHFIMQEFKFSNSYFTDDAS